MLLRRMPQVEAPESVAELLGATPPDRPIHRRERGQVLVIFAVVVALAVTILIPFLFGLSSARRQKGAIEEVSWAAMRAGAMQLDEAALAQGIVRLDVAQAEAAARATLAEGLSLLPFALADGATPEGIAYDPAQAQVYAVNASPGAPWTSPLTGATYTAPVVAVRVVVPSHVLFLTLPLPGQGEDQVFLRGAP